MLFLQDARVALRSLSNASQITVSSERIYQPLQPYRHSYAKSTAVVITLKVWGFLDLIQCERECAEPDLPLAKMESAGSA